MKQKAFYEQDGHFINGSRRFRFWLESDPGDRFDLINMAELDARKKEYECWPSEQND